MTVDGIGDVWTYACELALALAKHGITTALAVMGGRPSDGQRREAWRVPGLQLFESGYRLEWMEDPWEDVERSGRWLLELEDFLQPDVVHLNGYAHGVLPTTAPRLVVGHSCVLSRWLAVEDREAPATLDRYRSIVRDGLAGADAVAAPTAAFARCLARHYGLRADDIRTIPHGRRPTAFPPRRKETFVLAAGDPSDAARNVTALERIAPELPWPVCVVGAEPGSGSERNLRCVGRPPGDPLAAWYGRAALFAHPARYEPFGLAPLEAGLAGCALVLGDIPTLREVWGDAAVYVDPDDAGQLRDALLKLIRSGERRERMARRARERAFEYAPAAMAAGYLQLYEELRGRSRRPSAPTRERVRPRRGDRSGRRTGGISI